jgi:hypothetical protein
MKDEVKAQPLSFIPHPSAFILPFVCLPPTAPLRYLSVKTARRLNVSGGFRSARAES